MIRTALAGIFLAAYTLLIGPPFMLHCALTGRADVLYRVGLAGARWALRIAGVRVDVRGTEHIPPGVCIFAANHVSNVDPPAVAAAIPRRIALLAKKEVFRIPIFATALRLAAFIPVDRANREAAAESVELALGHLRNGVSYLIFPEGTRSPDGRLRPFKKGAFLLAIRARVPVVPISVSGSQMLLGKGEWAIRAGTMRVEFHAPVEAGEYSVENRDAMIARVHAAVAAGLPPEQQPPDGS